MANDADRDAVGSLVGHYRAALSPLRAYLKELHARYAGLRDGEVADYIPELAKADPDWFGICVATADGHVYERRRRASTRSPSSPSPSRSSTAWRWRTTGAEDVLARVGVEPTGDAFNSIIVDERPTARSTRWSTRAPSRPRAWSQGDGPAERLERICSTCSAASPAATLAIDMAVFASERATGHRNRAIAHLHAQLRHDRSTGVDEALDLYFQQCSVLVTAATWP